jgi:D-glycero-D-manno-heptose 1,7-bisphosphate phosphatase
VTPGGDAPGAPRERVAVFFDRDGTLNETRVEDGVPRPPADLAGLQILPGVTAGLARLKTAGFLLIVVTNQPDVARGTTPRATVEQIHTELARQLPLDAVLCCYHDDPDGCACRKPRPGMILEAARRFGVNPERSFVVGDRWRDIAAGHAAGCTTILLQRSYSEPQRSAPHFEAPDLGAAVEIILRCARS